VQGASRQPALFCSRLTLTSCVAGHFETQLSTEIVLLGSVANLACLSTFDWRPSGGLVRLSGCQAARPEGDRP
jgi:hypothetical protein